MLEMVSGRRSLYRRALIEDGMVKAIALSRRLGLKSKRSETVYLSPWIHAACRRLRPAVLACGLVTASNDKLLSGA